MRRRSYRVCGSYRLRSLSFTGTLGSAGRYSITFRNVRES